MPSVSTPSLTPKYLLVGETASSSADARALVGDAGFVDDRSRPGCDLSLLAPDYRDADALGAIFHLVAYFAELTIARDRPGLLSPSMITTG